MGDITLQTPLAQVEAPFVWVAGAGFAAALSLLPLVWVFRTKAGRAQWRSDYGGTLPWLARGRGPWVYAALQVAFVLLSALSYWICRGGHLYVHRVFPATAYYVTMTVYAFWSWPVALWNWRCIPTLVLAIGVGGGYITYIVAAFFAQPWVAGMLGCFGWVVLMGIAAAWRFPVDC